VGVTQEGQKCIFMLYIEVAEEDMEVQEETVVVHDICVFAYALKTLRIKKQKKYKYIKY